jgi:hypothetical protein
MRQNLKLPAITEEQALRRIIKWLGGARRNKPDPVNYSEYGHELFIPSLIFQLFDEVTATDRALHPEGMRSYEMNPDQPQAKVFYDAAWVLVQKVSCAQTRQILMLTGKI